jgi:hypothetical protein
MTFISVVRNLLMSHIQQNLIKIQEELDTIRALSKLSMSVLTNESIEIERFCFIFRDIEERCWKISELIEKFENNDI